MNAPLRGLSALALILAGAACRPADARPRPDVVVYLVDTLRADRVGVYGNQRGLTPAIDAFAAGPNTWTFERAVAQAPWTRSAVASLFTGLRPTTHGVTTKERRLDDSAVTLAEILRDAGYHTGGFSTNWHIHRKNGFTQGFLDWGFLPAATSSETLLPPIEDWIDKAAAPGSSPFFLYVHALDPHAPYQPPESFRQRFAAAVSRRKAGSFEDLHAMFNVRPRDRRERMVDIRWLYDAEVAAADAGFGRLLRALEAKGRLDNTIVVFLADHGEEFDEHLRFGHAVDLHGEGLWIPLLVKLDGAGRGGRKPGLAQQIDLLPSLLARLELAAPPGLQGRDLFARRGAAGFVVSHLDYDTKRGLAITTDRHRFIEPLSPGFAKERMLFDWVADPAERENLLSIQTALAERLRSQLTETVRQDYERRLAVADAEIDEEARRGLAALGYVVGGRDQP
jgi:arylsulfatase A-like enzyme